MGSSIEPTNNEERANPVADGGCWRTVTKEAAEQQARATVVQDNKEKIMRGGKKLYIGVYPGGDNWINRVSNGTDDDGKKKRVYLETFQTAKGAAIAFDTTVLHFRAEEPLHRLNFSQYASAIQGILKGRSD